MQLSAKSDIGNVRDVNEDRLYTYSCEGLICVAVADGMGGHNSGEVASAMAIETIKNNITDLNYNDLNVDALIIKIFKEANEAIYDLAFQKLEHIGMGTTLTVAILYQNILTIGHVGDSRAYIICDDTIKQITNDHSVVEELLKGGVITKEEAKNHPQRNFVTRAVGTDKTVEVDILNLEYKNEIVLLATDGLTNYISDDKILEFIEKNKDNLDDTLNNIMEFVKNTDAKDNISVVTFCV